MGAITITVVNPSGADIVVNEIKCKKREITDEQLKQMLRDLGKKQREALVHE